MTNEILQPMYPPIHVEVSISDTVPLQLYRDKQRQVFNLRNTIRELEELNSVLKERIEVLKPKG